MKWAVIIASALVVIALIAGGAWWVVTNGLPALFSPPREPAPLRAPADSDTPAAGVCAPPGEDEVVWVEVWSDIPAPRCQKVFEKNRIGIRNKSEVPVRVWFGDSIENAIIIAAGNSYVMPRVVDSFLERGVHVMHGDPYQGPEIWFVDERTPLLYRFGDRPVTEIKNERAEAVDYSDHPEAEMFKTQIDEGFAQGPNFAGHYTVVEWGCGTSCQMHAIIDAATGKIVQYGLGSALGLQYSLQSVLLIANPPSHIDETPEIAPGIFVEYYELNDGALEFLARQKPGSPEADVCAQVITRAKDPVTGEERDFPTPCAVPYGWEVSASPALKLDESL